MLKDTIKLLEEYGKPSLVVIHCGERERLKIDYPHAIIPVDEFHPRLLIKVLEEFAKLTARIIQEKQLTEIVKERRPLEEELGALELPQRPQETYRPGYLVKLLCENEG